MLDNHRDLRSVGLSTPRSLPLDPGYGGKDRTHEFKKFVNTSAPLPLDIDRDAVDAIREWHKTGFPNKYSISDASGILKPKVSPPPPRISWVHAVWDDNDGGEKEHDEGTPDSLLVEETTLWKRRGSTYGESTRTTEDGRKEAAEATVQSFGTPASSMHTTIGPHSVNRNSDDSVANRVYSSPPSSTLVPGPPSSA